jgi:uncharacterized membrane protein YfcA
VSAGRLALLAAVGFCAAAVGAITGGNSLLTVPAMLLAGMDARTAVATNMLGVTFLSAGATARFLRARAIPRRPTGGLILLALPGSILGAFVAMRLGDAALRLIISVAMLGMAAFIALAPRFGETAQARSGRARALGYALSAVWAIYGGLFSGGYTTVLTFGCVVLFGSTLVEAVALTKPVNFAGSAAATLAFAALGRIEWRLGVVLSAAMVVGGWMGAHLVLRAGTAWVRRIFVVTVAALAIKLLVDAFR